MVFDDRATAAVGSYPFIARSCYKSPRPASARRGFSFLRSRSRGYTATMQTTAIIDSANGIITMTRGAWSQTFAIADLPEWLAFYRRQRELFPVHAAHYDDDVAALEELAGRVCGSVGGRSLP